MGLTKIERQARANAKRVEKVYYATCNGITIPTFDIPKVFAEGAKACEEGVDDVELGRRIRAFVDTIRVDG